MKALVFYFFGPVANKAALVDDIRLCGGEVSENMDDTVTHVVSTKAVLGNKQIKQEVEELLSTLTAHTRCALCAVRVCSQDRTA